MKRLAYLVALLFASLSFFQAACGGDDGGGGDAGFTTMGMPGMPSPARTYANLIFAVVGVDGHEGPLMLIDTGAPITLIDPVEYPDIDFPDQAQIQVDLTFGSFTIDEVPAVQSSFLTDGNFTIPSIVGGNVVREFSTQLDYRGMQLRIGEGAEATGVEPGTEIAFELQGGGAGAIDPAHTMIVTFPATRIALDVDIEGTSHPVILDSGASEVTVRQELFDALVSDGRAQTSGFALQTANGPMSGRVTRARSISVGGEAVANPAVLSLGSDDLLDGLTQEIGHRVDGLLGGSYLREFLVTIDYPHRKLRLQRYVPASPVPDEFQRIGIDIHGASGNFAVSKVYEGSDAAAKQLAVGDIITSIDGQALEGLDLIAADLLLDGEVGSTKQVGIGAASNAAIANSVVSIRVEELLPPP